MIFNYTLDFQEFAKKNEINNTNFKVNIVGDLSQKDFKFQLELSRVWTNNLFSISIFNTLDKNKYALDLALNSKDVLKDVQRDLNQIEMPFNLIQLSYNKLNNIFVTIYNKNYPNERIQYQILLSTFKKVKLNLKSNKENIDYKIPYQYLFNFNSNKTWYLDKTFTNIKWKFHNPSKQRSLGEIAQILFENDDAFYFETRRNKLITELPVVNSASLLAKPLFDIQFELAIESNLNNLGFIQDANDIKFKKLFLNFDDYISIDNLNQRVEINGDIAPTKKFTVPRFFIGTLRYSLIFENSNFEIITEKILKFEQDEFIDYSRPKIKIKDITDDVNFSLLRLKYKINLSKIINFISLEDDQLNFNYLLRNNLIYKKDENE